MKHNFKFACARKPDVHKKPYPNAVKNILLYGTWNNAVVNQYKEASEKRHRKKLYIDER